MLRMIFKIKRNNITQRQHIISEINPSKNAYYYNNSTIKQAQIIDFNLVIHSQVMKYFMFFLKLNRESRSKKIKLFTEKKTKQANLA